MTNDTVIIDNKKYKVELRRIENGIVWLYCSRGRHGYAIADLGSGQFGKVNRLF
jgi:hypothetical protein